MTAARITLATLALALACTPTLARTPRSHSAKAAFQREHPCPSTGSHRGACKGWVVDHRIALCVGGSDIPENMRWMTTAAAKAKDRWECRPGWKEKLRECEAAGCFGV